MFRGNSGLILLYHRIAELTSDPQLLSVTPHRFAQHLEILRNYGTPMSLDDMLEAVRDGRLTRRAIAVTFDDGYADNADRASPLLARYGIPATLFVTTSYLGQEREFWWDDLERLLLLPGQLPRTLRLRIGPAVHEWRLDGSSVYSDEEYRRNVGWNVELTSDPSPRHTAYRALCRLLRDVSGEDRVAVLDDLSHAASVTSTARPTHRPLSTEDLAQVTQDGIMDVGAHSTTHPALSALPVGAQRYEIAGSKSRLQEITGCEAAGFSYPFGGRADYTPATVALVREAGFILACANVGGQVRPQTDCFQLPRVLVRNWDAKTFAGRLAEWFGD